MFTQAYPLPLSGDKERDVANMHDTFIAFVDEINHALENINGRTIKGDLSQATVEANRITTNQALIENAQIANLIADKIRAGTLDLSQGILISDGSTQNGVMLINQDSIRIMVNGVIRMFAGRKPNGRFEFYIQSEDGMQGIRMTEEGHAIFTGRIEASEIVGGTITVETDVNIGNNLYMTSTGFFDQGIFFVNTGMPSTIQSAAITIADAAAGAIDVRNSLSVNGRSVATQDDIVALSGVVSALSAQVTALIQQNQQQQININNLLQRVSALESG